jgi:hypothetical protein
MFDSDRSEVSAYDQYFHRAKTILPISNGNYKYLYIQIFKKISELYPCNGGILPRVIE